MAIKNEVLSIGFISLVTTDHDVFMRASQFYSELGFKLIKNYSKISYHGTSSGGDNRSTFLGIASDSLREIWLESVPLQELDKSGCPIPWQECPEYNGDGSQKLNDPTVVKIRLSSIEKLAHPTKRLDFFSANLSQLKQVLDRAGIQYHEGKHDGPHQTQLKDVRVVDPLGNELLFSSKETPLAEREFSDANEYLSYRSQCIKELQPEIKQKEDEQNPDQSHLHQSRSADSVTARQTGSTPGTKKKIAVMTSGGDAPGMNPAVRAVVRAGIYYGCDVFAVYEGYEGLVKGGDLLRPIGWEDVRSYLSLGGTAIGTARCAEFRERAGRLQGAYNMIVNGIDALIVCGGDGSLTGADLFRSEWPSLVDELVSTRRLTAKQVEPYRHLTIVGLVGSIDNDMSSTDATIGAYSSLARITELVDYLDATAQSHSRAFVVEVMGRHCGWLGLMAGVATGADCIFIPERPPPADQWASELKKVCSRHREKGRRQTTVIIAEGAIDNQLNPITAENVKDVLVDLGLDTRITTLGHVQRGGTAVAYDRLLATQQGVDAVRAVLELTPADPSPMIGIAENKVVRRPLMEAVKFTKEVAKSIDARDFDRAMQLRDSTFAEAYHNYLATTLHDDGSQVLPADKRLTIGIVHVGASSSGLNAATRAAALYCISKGHRLLAIKNGFSGLIYDGGVHELQWIDVENWYNLGGSEIGTNRSLPSENFGAVAYQLQRHQLDGLIIVGGFESFTALHEMESERDNYPVFRMPMVVIPATVSNNVPGTEYSLGADTCLNQLTDYCDAVKQSASSSRRRVFVVEVQGGHSGYMASCCGLVTGAIATYTPEATVSLRTIQEDILLLHDVFANDKGEDHNGKIIVRNEQASSVYSTELIADIVREAADGRFETRTAIPGHVQQGFTPSSMDRVYAVRFAVQACRFIEASAWHDASVESSAPPAASSAVVLGIQGARLRFSPISSLYASDADVSLRKGKTIHWHEINDINDILSGRLLLRGGGCAKRE
ncbi:Piso0_000107 [Millerozyma farinosa CBS 7064]|uniref:ATP-dependent 6-phosphofructokinase n=1 Tax=Pichia sorbitophila (strain ATCC MYA-4447 / BCRC 22081 / CBS 7064 / NBRC 10061 / NRRL Y-12695) TaxID=559304 RepID=G8YT39_PICSO|nr:Piso0_000107 [Millerozyma farinosa CBS 7064]